MAINVTTKKQQYAVKPYPKLVHMNHADSQGLIILKTNKECGTVIIPGQSGYQIGLYETCWSYNKDEDYNEPITLQNT